jgi:hypothetical protein
VYTWNYKVNVKYDKNGQETRTDTAHPTTNQQSSTTSTVSSTRPTAAAAQIPKPKGQAGKDYSLQVKMGLSKSTKGHLNYNAILVRVLLLWNGSMLTVMLQRSVRDAVSESRIAWQKPWAAIPASEKAILFSVVSTLVM